MPTIAPTSPPGSPTGTGGGGSTRPGGTTIYTPPALDYARPGVKLFVRRHSGAALPNLRLLSIEQHEFSPPTARFRYSFDTTTNASASDPYRVENCFALNSKGSRVAKLDERINVVRQVGTRSTQILFDGFVIAPQADISGRHEGVSLTVASTPIREWDTPLPGAIWRDSDGIDEPPNDDSDPSLSQDIQTDLPTRFNPDGKPNATAVGGESGTGSFKYPVFADPNAGPTRPVSGWTLPMAVRYCFMAGNPRQSYVSMPSILSLDSLLRAVRPTEDDGFIDLTKPNTFTYEDIYVSDIDVTGMCYPDAIRRLIEPHGFAFCYDLTTDSVGEPKWTMRFFRKDLSSGEKSVYLGAAGTGLVPGQSNVSDLSLSRDCAGIQNEWTVATAPVRYEASFVLDSAYAPSVGDDVDTGSTAGQAGLYVKGADPEMFDPEAYRVFIFDEDGDGHWNRLTGSMSTVARSLTNLFDPPKPAGSSGGGVYSSPPSEATAKRKYVRRRRPPIRDLVSTDATGAPREPELWVSTDYNGSAELWDKTKDSLINTQTSKGGTWQRVTKGGWRLLEDRIGIELTMSDPRSWAISVPGEEVIPSGTLNVVKSLCVGVLPTQAAPSPTVPRVAFRLTCTIEGDHDIEATAKRRPASPTRYTITRYEDARDRFKKQIVSRYSSIAASAGVTADVIERDDTDQAEAQADGRRRSNESGTFAGSITIPYYADALRVGERIKDVVGRKIDLAMNAAREQGEAAIYPSIIGVTHNFEGGQSTTYSLQDSRAELPPRLRRTRKA